MRLLINVINANRDENISEISFRSNLTISMASGGACREVVDNFAVSTTRCSTPVTTVVTSTTTTSSNITPSNLGFLRYCTPNHFMTPRASVSDSLFTPRIPSIPVSHRYQSSRFSLPTLLETRIPVSSSNCDQNFGNRFVSIKSEPSQPTICLLYTSPSPRDKRQSRMPSSA